MILDIIKGFCIGYVLFMLAIVVGARLERRHKEEQAALIEMAPLSPEMQAYSGNGKNAVLEEGYNDEGLVFIKGGK